MCGRRKKLVAEILEGCGPTSLPLRKGGKRLSLARAEVSYDPCWWVCACVMACDAARRAKKPCPGNSRSDHRRGRSDRNPAEPGKDRRGAAGGGKGPTARSRSRCPVDRSEGAACRQGQAPRHREWRRG